MLGRDTLEGDNWRREENVSTLLKKNVGVNKILTKVFQRTLLLVLLGGLAVHEVIEAGTALHEVVETTHDGKDTKGEDPDTDDSDNEIGRASCRERV